MKNSIFLRLSLLFCSLTLLGACGSLLEKVVQKPTVNLARVDFANTDLSSTTMIFVLDVANPNDFGLKVDEINYKVFLGEREFAATRLEEGAELTAKGSTQIKIPLPVSYSKLFDGFGQMLTQKAIAYRLEGDAKIGPLRVPFKETGKASLR